ncbi:MAG TPA: rod-binding protein [Syntrophales bacterium]|nr:rod-binding protein [Syntrophales bacterium]
MADFTTSKAQPVTQIPLKRIGDVKGKESEKEKKMRKVCADFESIFTYYMFKTMRQSIPQSGYFKQSTGKDAYNMLFDQKVAEEMANKGKEVGLQQALFNQLNK